MDDRVDRVLAQWRIERPDIDPTPMGIVGRISRAARILERALQGLFARFDLQPGEFDILATLRRSGRPYQLSAGALATSSMVTAGAITNRIDRLVAKDLVTRDLDPANRRAVIIALTTKGRGLIDKAVVAHLDNEQRLLAHLSAEDQERLATLLRDLLIALDDTPPDPSAPERP